jgi:low affinity Fe/Cu permease
MHSDDWGDGAAGSGHTPVAELVHSPWRLAWTCAAALAVSAVLIPFDQLWIGYFTGVAATALCMVTTVIDRQKRASPNYVATPGLQVEQHVRMVRIAAFVVCLIHIIRLAQQAAL